METWKVIPDYLKYEISDHGNYRNSRNKQVLKQCVDRSGYYRIQVADPIKRIVRLSVHRIVAIIFQLEGRSELRNEIDHIDQDKSNNTLSNLRWCSRSENINYIPYLNLSGFKGVVYMPEYRGKRASYKAVYRHNTITYSKHFQNPQDAYIWIQHEKLKLSEEDILIDMSSSEDLPITID